MKTIVLPTDFSENARNAARYAMELYRSEEVRFVLFYAYGLPARPTEIMMTSVREKLDDAAMEDLTQELETLLEDAPVTNDSFELKTEFGDVDDALLGYSSQTSPYLIVMGTQGARGIKEVLVGSNTASVISKSKVPVLCIPSDARFDPVSHIMVALDPDSTVELAKLDALRAFAERHKVKLTFLSLQNEGVDPLNFRQKDEIKAFFSNTPVTFTMMKHNNIEEGIERFIELHKPDWLVTLPGKSTFFDRLFQRSMTRKLALHTHLPLLVIPGAIQ